MMMTRYDAKDVERMDMLFGTALKNTSGVFPTTVIHHIHPPKISNRKREVHNAQKFPNEPQCKKIMRKDTHNLRDSIPRSKGSTSTPSTTASTIPYASTIFNPLSKTY
jgi:hypothetical protein